MEELKKEFQKYKIEKRIEISTMSSLIENLIGEFSKKEKNLLISSYIVLTYAYWESCFHKFQNLMFEEFKYVPIKSLPFDLRNNVSLTLANVSSGKNKKKLISEIKSIGIFEGMMNTVRENEESNVIQIIEKYSDRLEEKEIKKHFLLDTANPNLDRFQIMLKNYGVKLEQILEDGIHNSKIKPYFANGLNFIVQQRNSIAHKNEKIMYNEAEYDDYDLCIYTLASDIDFSPILQDHPEVFINEMTFQIDNFFDLMVVSLEKKIEGLVK